MAITRCEDCGNLTDGREFCSDCEDTAVYIYGANQIAAATRPDDANEPESA